MPRPFLSKEPAPKPGLHHGRVTASFGCLLLVCSLSGVCCAELPDYYQSVDRVIWVVRDVKHVVQGWKKLGLSDIHEYPDTGFTARYRDRQVMIHVRRTTGQLGSLRVDLLQPAKGEQNVFSDFLSKHGDGIFAVVHAVSGKGDIDKEEQRLSSLGVRVLQEATIAEASGPCSFTFFDTEREGKFVLGLSYSPYIAAPANGLRVVSHIAPVVRDPQAVAAFWHRLGFPDFTMEHATPREDSRYRGKPLLLSFEVGFQRFGQMSYEWITPPATPPNIYSDFLRLHGEGIQHLGLPVENLGEAAAKYEKLGYTVWQSGAWGDVGKPHSGQYDYMDTEAIGGVSVELIHAYQ